MVLLSFSLVVSGCSFFQKENILTTKNWTKDARGDYSEQRGQLTSVYYFHPKRNWHKRDYELFGQQVLNLLVDYEKFDIWWQVKKEGKWQTIQAYENSKPVNEPRVDWEYDEKGYPVKATITLRDKDAKEIFRLEVKKRNEKASTV